LPTPHIRLNRPVLFDGIHLKLLFFGQLVKRINVFVLATFATYLSRNVI
jgi:hypothetical protein